MKRIFFALLIFSILTALLGGRQWAQAASPLIEEMRHPAAQKMDAAVQMALQALPAGSMLTVIVTLKEQADLAAPDVRGRPDRLRATIEKLQAHRRAAQQAISAALTAGQAQGRVGRVTSFWIFNGLAVTATAATLQELAARPDVLAITPDETDILPVGSPALAAPAANLAALHVPAVWNLGFFGQGVVVASLDSGVDLAHPELAARYRGGANSWFDPYGQHPTSPIDLSGHGTWTMGVMVGGDASGETLGVAPQAQWIAAKIFNDNGQATASAIHLAFQWVLDPDGNPATADAPQVVNNSWAYGTVGCNLTFQSDLIALRAAGILPVFAAGNYGPGANTSSSPANNPQAFAVGAVDNAGALYAPSSRGPAACGETAGIFPELVAPGVNIPTTDLYGLYTSAGGTSLAAPHVAGALALLLQAFPGLNVESQAAALQNSAVDLGTAGPDNSFGYGRLDVLAAYQWLAAGSRVTPTPNPTATPAATATPLPTATITPLPTISLHVGDLDRNVVIAPLSWSATVRILVHNALEQPVAGVTVVGKWSNGVTGAAGCLTNTAGTCTVSKTGPRASLSSATLTITGLTKPGGFYSPSANHDPDGDSNGSAILMLVIAQRNVILMAPQ